jgi:alpha-glucosidase (family GH31 glycosyl hydrolase)
MADEILRLARHAARTGEPILRHLAYAYPGMGFESVTDQFMLGEEFLVAPVLEKNADRRRVAFPPGTWAAEDGSLVEGPGWKQVKVTLASLPWYRRV